MKKKVVVSDDFQEKYTYFLVEPVGKNFHPDFKPQLSPKEMLELGVFGGKYLSPTSNEFPKSWFKHAKISKIKDHLLNYFQVDASQSWSAWVKKGWIDHQDPRGWFEWYCRYYMGRRTDDDLRQIKRWKAMARHIGQIKNNCLAGDLTCRQKQRQALLHWAYDSRKL